MSPVSEYQYYEFQAVDRPLTQEQMSELRTYSSRAHITPSSFINVYNWGDFRGDPDKLMELYFDAFLYLANWGTRRLMLRLPERLFEPQVVNPYCSSDCVSSSYHNGNVILSFLSDSEDFEWVEGEGWLASILPVRSDLLKGDYRALYLGWLLAVQSDKIAGDEPEPPVPPGLGTLSASLDRFVAFLRIDSDLIAAAAEGSQEQGKGPSEKDFHSWVRNLPGTEKDQLLVRLIDGDDPHLAAELRQRALHELGSGEEMRGTRTAGEIRARARVLCEERNRKEAERRRREERERQQMAAENRQKHLDSLAGKESELWDKVDDLIATRQQKSYDVAVDLLRDLRDLADREGKLSDFLVRLSALSSEHARKTSLLRRLRNANLLRRKR